MSFAHSSAAIDRKVRDLRSDSLDTIAEVMLDLEDRIEELQAEVSRLETELAEAEAA